MAHAILYPAELDESDHVRAKAEVIFQANLICKDIQSQYDVRANAVFLQAASAWIFSYMVVCTICGCVVDKDRANTTRHLELHQARGE